MEIKDFILEYGKKLNIDIISFTDGRPSKFLEPTLKERIRDNKLTEFENTNINEKININDLIENYNSTIVIGQSYINDFNEKVNFNTGNLSRSTWGKDYHIVLKKLMGELIVELKENFGGNYKSYVDTGPLVDRNLAYTSGIGYYGKNATIINDKFGSFIFIGYIITDLIIEIENIELKSECGDCYKCLRYCPTNAIESPYMINPKKCISYLTQTKEKIPYELRSKMGKQIYGCDICQMVCPKNKDIEIKNHDDFIPYKTKGYVDIDEILDISKAEFAKKYGDMSGAWRGKNILKRNAIIAIGNKKDSSYLNRLISELYNDSQMIAEYALWSILKIDSKSGSKLIDSEIKKGKINKNLIDEYNTIKSFLKI